MLGPAANTAVLIVGAGPTGLMAANLLARYGIPFRIIDKRTAAVKYGPCHNIHSRSLEILHSMGLQDSLNAKGARIREYAFWNPDWDGQLRRTNIGLDVTKPTRFPWTLSVEKGDLCEVLAENLKRRSGLDTSIGYGMELLSFRYEPLADAVAALVKNHTSGLTETWYISYVLGCDGDYSAHADGSASVRDIAGIALVPYGEAQHWATARMVADSDFPDIRRRCTLRTDHGNFVFTPCADGALRVVTHATAEDVQAFTERSPTNLAGAGALRRMASVLGSQQGLQDHLNSALSPYTITIKEVQYISQHNLQKCLAQNFASDSNRVFLLGSAAHVHSPLMKQGINSGLQDAWNLAWKLVLVVRGHAAQDILSTYETERRGTLPKALELDAAIDALFSVKPGDKSLNDGLFSWEEASGYTSGCGTRYAASCLVREEVRSFVKKSGDGVREPLAPGKRLLPLMLTRCIDGDEVDSLTAITKPDGRFKLLAFVGAELPSVIFTALSAFLASSRSPLLCLNTAPPPNSAERVEGYVVPFVVTTVSHFKLDLQALPEPWTRFRENVLEDPGGRMHAAVGISVKLPTMCLVRPDGYVGVVTNLDDGEGVRRFMRGLLSGSAVDEEAEMALVDAIMSYA